LSEKYTGNVHELLERGYAEPVRDDLKDREGYTSSPSSRVVPKKT